MVSLMALLILLQCTYTKDANGNVLLGPGCTASNIFVDAPNGDFRLVSGAPAIDNAQCLPDVREDFAGNPRPTPGRGCDIGAYQFIPMAPVIAPPTNLRIFQKGQT